MPDQAPVNKYNVPISLWLQDQSHLEIEYLWFPAILIYFKRKVG